MKRESRRRFSLCVAFAALAVAAAIWLMISSAVLDRRLVDERVLTQVGAIVSDIEHRAAAGAPIRDYTGFHAAAAAVVAAEETLRAIRVFGDASADADAAPLFEVEEARPAMAEGERRLHADIRSRNATLDSFGAIGRVDAVLHAQTLADRLADLPFLIVSATVVLALIGFVYLAAVAEDSSLRGRSAGWAWFLAAICPGLAMCVWLIAASADFYRQNATVAADIAADRLRPAVAMNIELATFEGLEEVFAVAEANPNDAAAGPLIGFALVEGRRPILTYGAMPEGFWTRGVLGISVTRSVRPRSLSAPALSVTATLSWRDVALRGLRDHPAALAAIAAYVFAPAAFFWLFGRRKA